MAESHRDHIVFAARALSESDWRKAFSHIKQITAFSRSAEFSSPEFLTTFEMEFKKTALVTFLYRGVRQYKAFKLDSLCELFQMDMRSVRKAAAQLIMQNKLQMSLDLANGLLVINQDGTDIKEI